MESFAWETQNPLPPRLRRSCATAPHFSTKMGAGTCIFQTRSCGSSILSTCFATRLVTMSTGTQDVGAKLILAKLKSLPISTQCFGGLMQQLACPRSNTLSSSEPAIRRLLKPDAEYQAVREFLHVWNDPQSQYLTGGECPLWPDSDQHA